MITVTIIGAEINSISEVHEIIKDKLYFPGWYGTNFDALHDCLTDISEETVISIEGFNALKENIGPLALALRRVLYHSSIENPSVSFICTD